MWYGRAMYGRILTRSTIAKEADNKFLEDTREEKLPLRKTGLPILYPSQSYSLESPPLLKLTEFS